MPQLISSYCTNVSKSGAKNICQILILGTESTSDKQDGKRNAAPSIKRDAGSGLPAYKGSRFGFRASNIVRPASAGLTPKVTDFEENIENNNVTG